MQDKKAKEKNNNNKLHERKTCNFLKKLIVMREDRQDQVYNDRPYLKYRLTVVKTN